MCVPMHTVHTDGLNKQECVVCVRFVLQCGLKTKECAFCEI
jgi:hypothetical protein